jgi:hypothetical protein
MMLLARVGHMLVAATVRAAPAAVLFACSLDAAGIDSGTGNAPVGSTGEGGGAGVGGAGVGGATGGTGGIAGSTSSAVGAGGGGTTGAGGAPPGDCAPGTSTIDFRDNFDDNKVAPTWNAFQDLTVTTVEKGGEVVVTLGSPQRTGGYSWIDGARSLIGCHVAIQVRQVPTLSVSAPVFLTLFDNASNELSIEQDTGKLVFTVSLAGKTPTKTSIPYKTKTHLWWQILEKGGMTYFQTGGNGRDWSAQRVIPTPTFVNAVKVKFGARAVDASVSGSSAHFDNLNVTL